MPCILESVLLGFETRGPLKDVFFDCRIKGEL